jgi:hypothetical protein
MIYSKLLEIPVDQWLRYTGHVIQTVYGPGDLVVLDDHKWAIRLRLDCVPGCRRIMTVYLRGDMAYEHDGTFIADLQKWEYRCEKHRPL